MQASRATVPEVGDEVDLEIGDVAHGGVFVARADERVVFVADTAPGERVRARITQVKRSFARAVAIEVQQAHEARRPHVWPEADIARAPERRPGGAEFGHLRLDVQRGLKGRVITDALRRFGGVERDVEVEATEHDRDGEGTGWRTRVTLHADEAGAVGPYAARSHDVAPVEHLPLAVPGIDALAARGRRVRGPGRIEFTAATDGEPRVRFVPDRGRAPRAGVVREHVGERVFEVDEDGFWQVHRDAAATLVSAVGSAIDPALLDPAAANLDLYGGVGLLATAFADVAGPDVRVETVESASAATGHARRNLSGLPRSSAVTARVDRYLERVHREAGAAERASLARATVVLDPPRAGAGAEVVRSLTDLAPAQIVYVACDPVAFARDVGTFRELGYELVGVRAFDLFPSTHHVECVGTLRPVR